MSENSLYALSQDDDSELTRGGASRLTLAVTSNAPANGQAVNTATAYFSRHGAPQRHRRIDFRVTGNARFSNGTAYISEQTDAHGKATVLFTDIRPEGVTLIAEVENNIEFRSVDFRANALHISAEVWVDGAPGDGDSANQLFYHVYDSVTNQPIGNAIIEFSVVIGQGQLSTFTGITTSDGAFRLSVTKSESGSVLIGAQVKGYPAANNYTYLNFSERQARYRLTVQIFPTGTPGLLLVVFTLIDIYTGLGVPGKLINLFCGVEQSFNMTIGPTGADGTKGVHLGNVPGAVNLALAVLADDETVNVPFDLIF